MSFKALVYAYVLGGLTLIPLVILGLIFFTIYTSIPVGDADPAKLAKEKLEKKGQEVQDEADAAASPLLPTEVNDSPRSRRGWLTVRRTYEQTGFDGNYVAYMRNLLDSRSKDPKRSRPKDMWYVVLKGRVLYLYEDEAMTECEAAIELSSYDVTIYPEGLMDGELFARRNAICLKTKLSDSQALPSLTREMTYSDSALEEEAKALADTNANPPKEKEKESLEENERTREDAREEALNSETPWFIFVRSTVEMEDWYLSIIHASNHPANTSTLAPLASIFRPTDMNHLVQTLDEQPDVIPMRWLNAIIGRIFFSFYRTRTLEEYIISRIMKKLSKVKRPGFLTEVAVTEVSVGNTAPTFSKPMLKELTKEGDAAIEMRLHYKGEVRLILQATAVINLGSRFKSYTVKLVLAVVLREMEGNLLVKIKRPPSNRLWYAFTQTPRMVLSVEPIVSDRQITWSMVLNQIEARIKEIIQESIVLPNMDDISFFPSAEYAHRGGIWTDACRSERTTAPSSPPTEDEKTKDNILSASAPVLDTINSQSSTLSEPEQPQRPFPIQVDDDSTKGKSTEGQVMRSVTDNNVTEGGKRERRRTWFSSVSTVKNASGSSIQEQQEDDKDKDEEESRGRTTGADLNSLYRSRSTPTEGERNPSFQQSEETPSQTLSPQPVSRPSSLFAGPSRRSSVSSSPEDAFRSEHQTESSGHSDSGYSSYRPKSPKQNSGAGSTTSSFLSTLKSKAADKQALSNSAKEAMRKWGVNWGGLKRDSGSSGLVNEDTPDVHGSAELARQRVDSHKDRPRYTTVVESRKERERLSRTDSKPDEIRPSEPITIPEGSNGKGRSVSGSSRASSFTGGLSPSVPSSSKPQSSPAGSITPPKVIQPSVSRTTAELHTANSIVENSQTSEIDGPDSLPLPSTPIHTQPPQAKTMTIPGIHASHRGEVMSMGYSAPAPSPPPESKNKSAAIQSVYKLWKSPTLSGKQLEEQQQQPPVEAETGSQAAGPQGAAESEPVQNYDATFLSPVLTTNSAKPPKPVPPPLPPRTSGMNRLRSDTPIATPNSPPTPSAASEALKFIASKDAHSRGASLDAVTSTTPGEADPATQDDSDRQTSSDVWTSTNNDPTRIDHENAMESATPPVSPTPVKRVPPQLPPRRTLTSS